MDYTELFQSQTDWHSFSFHLTTVNLIYSIEINVFQHQSSFKYI